MMCELMKEEYSHPQALLSAFPHRREPRLFLPFMSLSLVSIYWCYFERRHAWGASGMLQLLVLLQLCSFDAKLDFQGQSTLPAQLWTHKPCSPQGCNTWG